MQLTHRTSCQAPEKSILAFAKNTFSAPLFVVMLVLSTVSLGFNVVAIAKHNSPLEILAVFAASAEPELKQLFITFGSDTLMTQLIAVIPMFIALGGLWYVFVSAIRSSEEKQYRIGFTIVQVVRFNMLLITGLMILCLDLYLFLNKSIQMVWNRIPDGVELAYKIGIGLISAFVIFINFKILAMFSFMKETICENSPIAQISRFVALTCIIWGGFYAMAVVAYAIVNSSVLTYTGFIMSAVAGLLQSLSAIVFGSFILSYRGKIIAYTEKE